MKERWNNLSMVGKVVMVVASPLWIPAFLAIGLMVLTGNGIMIAAEVLFDL